ncbi:MAG: transposase [Proteobacteria bacterium]|nr:transposase [Pseudomonadota bacterium]
MPRVARIVVPGYPHHVTQRGNRRQRTFFNTTDYLFYLSLLIELKDRAGVDVWAYCLMPNHVHLVAVPQEKLSLAKLFGVAHHRYALRVNSAQGWQGHLWQERYHSSVLDESHLIAAVRYIERNPVRAGLCAQPEDWRWSSVHAHLTTVRDDLVNTAPMCQRISDWREYLSENDDPGVLDSLRVHTRTGRPAGDEQFVDKLEVLTGQRLRRRRPGPDPWS